jgi:Leucine-rich repeat (LRR) protein
MSKYNLLKVLFCYENELTTLNLEDCKNLLYLSCHANKLQSLYIRNGSNEEGALDFSLNPELAYICCDNSQYEKIAYAVYVNEYKNCTISLKCIKSIPNPSEVVIHPNPASSVLFIDSPDAIEKIEIFDYLGHSIQDIPLLDKFITLTNLPAGIYLVKIYTNGAFTTKKFVKV